MTITTRSLKHLGATAALAIAAGTAADAGDTIKIGVLLPVSGGGASYGVPAEHGVQLAVNEINAAGGINGKMVEYILRDTQMNPSIGVAAAKELISKEGVDVLLGAVSSGVTLALSEIAKQEKIVLMAPISKAGELTDENLHPYIFQTSAVSPIEGKAIATIAAEAGATSLCMTGFDYAYTHSLFKEVAKNLPDSITISNTYNVALGTKDYNAVIAQLMGDKCDTVVGAIFGGGFIAFANQAQPFGLFDMKKFVWGGEVGSTEMTSALGADYPPNMWANAYDLWYSGGTPALDKYHADLAALEGQQETFMWPITTYVGMKFLAAAIEKAQSTDSDALVAALEGLTVETPMGPRTIDAKTHRANTGEFWGPMLPGEGGVYRMTPPRYVE